MPTLTELANADYSVKCFSGATRMQSELSAAFDLVAPKDNWKNPIDCKMPVADKALLTDAIVHFTGSIPHFGQGRIKAAGYYLTIGA